MLQPIDFLNGQERLTVFNKIQNLKQDWNKRKQIFYTLGTALYLDAVSDFNEYKNKAKKTNKLLLENFSFLYERLQQVLEKELKEKVVYEEDLALPGFHIFVSPQNEEESSYIKNTIPSIHFDLQFMQVNWPYKIVETDKTISFTLAISLPSAGAGLNYWDMMYENYPGISNNILTEVSQSKERHYCAYKEDKIVIHTGLTLHQLDMPKELKKDDSRITMQGHAIRCDGVWRIYW